MPTDSNSLPYPPASVVDQQALAAFARETPLSYGTWGTFKRCYKDVEANPLADPAIFGAFAARLDAAPLSSSTSALPVDLGATARGVRSIAVIGRRVYCLLNQNRAMQFAGFEFDAENLLKPILIGSGPVSNGWELVPCGPFVALLGGGLESGTFSIFDPSRSDWRGQVALGAIGRAVAASPLVYVAVHGLKNAWNGLRILDMTDPDQPYVAGELAIKEAQHVAYDGAIAAVTSGETRFRWGQLPSAGGLSLVNVTDPRRPQILGSLSLSNPTAVALRGSLAFVGTDRNSADSVPGLYIIDVADPARPRKRSFLATRHHAPKEIVLQGDFAYLITEYGYPQIIDISQPDTPTVVGDLHTYSATDIAIADGIAYVGTSYQGLELYSVANPAKPTRIGMPPSGATLGYMKRRVRRVLRNSAKTDPDGYIALAAATLSAALPAKDAIFDHARQWVLADILYGGSDRFVQRRHGRGPLKPTTPRLRLRTREERMPQAWDQHLDTAADLLMNPSLPWPIHEAMLKILLTNGTSLPNPSSESLAGFLASPSALLIHFAVRPLTTQMERGEPIAAETAATAYVKTGTARRRIIESALSQYVTDPVWGRAFAGQVFDLASTNLKERRLPRRYASACEMVARRFPNDVSSTIVRTMAAALLNAERSSLTDLVLALAQRVTPSEVLEWLQLLSAVTDAQQEQVVQALASGLTSHAFTLAEAQKLVLHHGDEFGRVSGWRLLAASITDVTVFQALWTGLLDSPHVTPPLRTAMTSPAALSCLARAGLSSQAIADRLRERPFLAGLLSPQTFAAILPTVPASVALSLIAAVSDNQWANFRPFLQDFLARGEGPAAFWNAAPAAFDADTEGRLERRLLADTAIADTLTEIQDPSLLSICESAFDTVLGQWVRGHEELFSANSPLLLQAATHMLPSVRTWALDRVRSLGMDMPFALRLLESSLPDCLNVGGAFFTSLPNGDLGERGYALALCDSPLAAVRALGRTFVLARWDTLLREDLLRALFENSHPDMQAFVAELLAQSLDRPSETAGFDGEVLRTRHTARRAKEQVKARQSAEPTVDVATLLTLARSRTPRDSEWALSQLAKLALSGHEIEGFTVSGVAGG